MKASQMSQLMAFQLIKFKPTFTQQIRSKLLTKEMKKCLEQPRWESGSGVELADYVQILTFIQEVPWKKYVLTFGSSIILKNICSPVFTQLTQLFLTLCNITNIESLQYINAPKLQFLDLTHNHITQTKLINKANFPFLNRLHFYENPIIKMQGMRVKFQRQLSLLYEETDQDSNILVQNLAQFLKSQPTGVQQFQISHPNRIPQLKVQLCIVRKYNHIQIVQN